MISLRQRALRSLRYRGLRRTTRVAFAFAAFHLRHGPRAPRPDAFDLEFGTTTASTAFGRETTGAPIAGNHHEGIDPVEFDAAMALLPPSFPFPEFSFVDFGSGQGRALLLASSYPFRRILGVEFAREFHQVAQANLRRYRFAGQRCADIHSVWENALSWKFPQNDPAIFYFSEPFLEPVMRAVAGRIRASLAAAPRPAYVMYMGDWWRGVWEEPGDFEIVATGVYERIYRWGAGRPVHA